GGGGLSGTALGSPSAPPRRGGSDCLSNISQMDGHGSPSGRAHSPPGSHLASKFWFLGVLSGQHRATTGGRNPTIRLRMPGTARGAPPPPPSGRSSPSRATRANRPPAS